MRRVEGQPAPSAGASCRRCCSGRQKNSQRPSCAGSPAPLQSKRPRCWRSRQQYASTSPSWTRSGDKNNGVPLPGSGPSAGTLPDRWLLSVASRGVHRRRCTSADLVPTAPVVDGAEQQHVEVRTDDGNGIPEPLGSRIRVADPCRYRPEKAHQAQGADDVDDADVHVTLVSVVEDQAAGKHRGHGQDDAREDLHLYAHQFIGGAHGRARTRCRASARRGCHRSTRPLAPSPDDDSAGCRPRRRTPMSGTYCWCAARSFRRARCMASTTSTITSRRGRSAVGSSSRMPLTMPTTPPMSTSVPNANTTHAADRSTARKAKGCRLAGVSDGSAGSRPRQTARNCTSSWSASRGGPDLRACGRHPHDGRHER